MRASSGLRLQMTINIGFQQYNKEKNRTQIEQKGMICSFLYKLF